MQTPKMINFLDASLLPKVETTAAVMDNYEATNLISSNSLIRSRGFLAYTSIKPPIDLDFHLIVPVSLHYICISATVGNQRTTGIEIFAGTNNNADFVSLGSAVFESDGVIFCNARYYSVESRPINTNIKYHLSFFKRNHFRIFLNAKAIRIRIFRTQWCAPCVGSIKIIGRLSKSCSAITASTINRLVGLQSGTEKHRLNNLSFKCMEDVDHVTDEFEIPEDFKDGITFELMVIPMTLPSGHTVDKTTIDKCLQNDIRAGRSGIDPFTGIKFSGHSQPIPNVALKTRIDLFMTQNAHRVDTYKLRRTVGNSLNVLYSMKRQTIDLEKCHSEASTTVPTGDDDMDSIIKQARMLPNFKSYSNHTITRDKTCCQHNCDDSNNLYRIVCNHYYCKHCIEIKCNVGVCSQCNRKFSRTDVEKYNK